MRTSPIVAERRNFMASRKDKKGRVLRKGESFRITDEMYVYAYTDPFGKEDTYTQKIW